MTFDKNTTYHRNDLGGHFGVDGGEPVFVLHNGDEVLAFTVNRWNNPQAPAEILVAPGTRREKLAEWFIASGESVPVFINEERDSKEWRYVGDFALDRASEDNAEKNQRVKPFDIPAIYKILFLKEVVR